MWESSCLHRPEPTQICKFLGQRWASRLGSTVHSLLKGCADPWAVPFPWIRGELYHPAHCHILRETSHMRADYWCLWVTSRSQPHLQLPHEGLALLTKCYLKIYCLINVTIATQRQGLWGPKAGRQVTVYISKTYGVWQITDIRLLWLTDWNRIKE